MQDLSAQLAVERRLGDAVRAGSGLSGIVRMVSELTGRGAALFGFNHRLMTSARPSGPRAIAPLVVGDLRKVGPLPALQPAPGRDRDRGDGDVVLLAARPALGVQRRHLVAPVRVAADHVGWLVLAEHPLPFRELDELTARRAAIFLGAEFAAQRRFAAGAWNARSSLARHLVKGSSNDVDLLASAEYLGVDVHARRILAYLIGPRAAAAGEDEALAAGLERILRVPVLSTRGSQGILLLIEAPPALSAPVAVEKVKSALAQVSARLLGPGAVAAGVSSVCEPANLRRGYREAQEVARCIDRFAPGSAARVLAVDELGPARLFLAHSDRAAVHGYLDDVLGALLTGAPGMATLLRTLEAYFDSGRHIRQVAAVLGVHENTVRLRLARVHAATGLDVAADPSDQLSIQTALLVLRLQAHPALSSSAPSSVAEGPPEVRSGYGS